MFGACHFPLMPFLPQLTPHDAGRKRDCLADIGTGTDEAAQ
jgi:hypothetical protein